MSSEARLLTDGQRRLVGFATALFALLATLVLLATVIWALAWAVGRFSGVLWPLAVAGILALMLRPAVDLLQRRLRLRRLAAVVLLYALFVLAAGGLALLVVPPLIRQVLDFIAYLPTLWQQVVGYVQAHYPDWVALARRYAENPAVRNALHALAGELQGLLGQALPSLRAAGAGLLALVAFGTGLAVIPIYLFFFLLSRGEPTSKLADHLPFLSPGVRGDVVFLVREFVGIVTSFFRGQMLIGLIMGILLAAGFSLIGLRFGLFIGLALGVLNIIPYLGTIVGLAVVLPLAFFQADGGWALVGLALLVKIIVQAVEGWLLTPRIMGERTGLHPVAIIVAVFFWGTALGGVLGMILAVPLTAFFVTAWRLLKQKYFAPA
ncbi:MAG TPA: AI-2E family transporter [Opitutaceae bacterium]|nr:AI-2E family transporter [Opitutaceae bacterium]